MPSIYRHLTKHLDSHHDSPRTFQFKEIEAILGFPLPKSARLYPAWWSNQVGNGHSQSAAWQSIGWRTGRLDLANERVTFFRKQAEDERPAVSPVKKGLTIAQAKAGLSAYYGVPPEDVAITIKG
jgi:hypothetical protein